MSLTLEFDAPTKPWSINEERGKHWSWRHKRAKEWREYAWAHGMIAVDPPRQQQPAEVTVHLPVPDNRRRDPSNYLPAVKAIIDGLVDARFWPDDTPEWVTVMEPVLVAGAKTVTVEIIDRIE